jgi:hypothetical protein
MDYAEYAVWALAIFFAGTWAFGLVTSPRNRIGSTILTVIIWWVLIAFASTETFSVFHLLWAFPVALVAPVLLLAGRRML